MRTIEFNNTSLYPPVLKPVFNNTRRKYRSRFLISKGQFYIKVNVEDIAFFYLSNDLIYAVTFCNKEFHINSQMKTLDTELNPDFFKRVNRQTIINVDCIQQIEPYFNGKLIIKTQPASPDKIIVSKPNSKAFKDWIDQ